MHSSFAVAQLGLISKQISCHRHLPHLSSSKGYPSCQRHFI